MPSTQSLTNGAGTVATLEVPMSDSNLWTPPKSLHTPTRANSKNGAKGKATAALARKAKDETVREILRYFDKDVGKTARSNLSEYAREFVKQHPTTRYDTESQEYVENAPRYIYNLFYAIVNTPNNKARNDVTGLHGEAKNARDLVWEGSGVLCASDLKQLDYDVALTRARRNDQAPAESNADAHADVDVMELDGEWSEVIVTQPTQRLQKAARPEPAVHIPRPATRAAHTQINGDLTSTSKVNGWLDGIREDPIVARPLFNETKHLPASKCFPPTSTFPLDIDSVRETLNDISSQLESVIQKECVASGIEYASPSRFHISPPLALNRLYSVLIGHQKIGTRKAKVMQSLLAVVLSLALTGAFLHDNAFNGDKFPIYDGYLNNISNLLGDIGSSADDFLREEGQ